VEIIKPYYFKGERGRPPHGIEVMPGMYLLQIWFVLADESVEENICDSYAMRRFTEPGFYGEGAPDATTLLDFRRLLEKNNLRKTIFGAVSGLPEKQGKIMRGGSVAGATIIEAPSSAKNSTERRGQEEREGGIQGSYESS
jgi:IS5 family transposase